MKGQITKEDTIDILIELRLVQNYSMKSIIEYLKNLGYKKSQCYKYVNWMQDKIKKEFDKVKDSVYEETILQYEEMLRIAKERNDIRLWNDLKKEMSKLMGLYAADKIDLTVTEYKAKFGE